MLSFLTFPQAPHNVLLIFLSHDFDIKHDTCVLLLRITFFTEKQEVLTYSRNLLETIYQKKRSIKATIVEGRNRLSTKVWKSFESSYAKDITVS